MSYCISIYLVRIKILDSIQTLYFSGKNEKIKINTIKYVRLFSSIIVLFTVFVLAAMQFYRLNKWWLKGIDSEFLTGLNDTLLGNIISIGCILVALIVLLLITLIPTQFLKPELVATGILLKKYSEAFRKEYDFTKEEWYGEE